MNRSRALTPNRDKPQTCLSIEAHDNRVLDITRHYFGCLKVSARDHFFNSLPDKYQRRIRREARRFDQLRAELEYQPDTRAGALLIDFQESMDNWRGLHPWIPVEPKRTPRAPYCSQDDGIDSEIKAPMIFFKDSRPYDIPGVENVFPNQKISISQLLADDATTNPLMQPCDDNTIRYFHLPANNMIWVEEAMARYYHEKHPDAEDLFLNSKLGRKKTKTEMLLAPEFWQGQQHFEATSEVHARHMRPLCNAISINPISTEPLPKNLVLFTKMPYLHWETDRGRMQAATAIKEASSIKHSMAEIVGKALNEQAMQANPNANVNPGLPSPLYRPAPPAQPPSSVTKSEKRFALGLVLRRAAALMEELDFRIEDRLISKYLHAKPPLHPRRTLDQSYYGALKDTGTRDRDQVVYRATTPAGHDCADFRDGADPWKKCWQCQKDAKKVPRLIMVDQLWLWILDERTVISSFPRRFGKNKPDPSAIHKSLRQRLKSARKDEIRSAYDLALIIIDECSRVFFDRSKSSDRQPSLADIFADAISGVAYKQTAAFNQFLIYTHLASKEYDSRPGSNSVQNTLLNINLEGNLLKEIKDILDELHILTRVKLQQQSVAESFVKLIKQSLLPQLRPKPAWDPIIALYMDECYVDADLLQQEQRAAAELTTARAEHLLNDIQDRIAELNVLEGNARKTASALKDILTLKQQQASVMEAREAVKQASETLRQGKSIMLFTVVTILFLPLSFFTGIFGMNSQEFNGSTLTLSQQFTFMFPISACITAISIILAFARSSILSSLLGLLWTQLSSPASVAATWCLTRSGMYTRSRDMAARASALRDRERKATALMKADELRANVKLSEMQEIMARLPRGVEDDIEGATPRVGTVMSRIGTPMLGGMSSRGTPRLTAAEFEDDVEQGLSIGGASQVRLVR